MDMRYERLQYLRRVSRKTMNGVIYHDPWHRWGCYQQRREDKYKNIDRATIRKPPNPIIDSCLEVNGDALGTACVSDRRS